MKKVYSASDPVNAHLLREILEDNGIRSVVQDERLFAARGEIPVVYPTVWVSEADIEAALPLIKQFESRSAAPAKESKWICPKCGEEIEGQFVECWKCNVEQNEVVLETEESASNGKQTIGIGFKLLIGCVILAILAYVFAIRMYENKYDAIDFYNQGVTDSKNNDLESAIAQYTRAIALDSGNYKALLNRGLAYSKKRDYDAAIVDFSKAIQIDNSYAKAYRARASAYIKKESFDSAISDSTRAIELDPKMEEAYLTRGVAHSRQESPDKALFDYTRAIEINPRDATAYAVRSIIHWRLGNLDSTEADAAQAIRLRPSSSPGFDMRGLVHLGRGELDEAISDFTQAIQLDEKSTSAWINRGTAFQAKGDLIHALEDFGHAADRDPDSLSAFCARGRLLKRRGDMAAAETDFKHVTELRPKKASEFGSCAIAWAGLGYFDKALTYSTQLITKRPWDRFAYYIQACVYCMRAKSHASTENDEKLKQADIALAIDSLVEGCKRGLCDWALLKSDPELEILRPYSGFQKLIMKP